MLCLNEKNNNNEANDGVYNYHGPQTKFYQCRLGGGPTKIHKVEDSGARFAAEPLQTVSNL